jgi:hypothetical protein
VLLRHEFELKVGELNAEIGLLRADQTLHRTRAKGGAGRRNHRSAEVAATETRMTENAHTLAQGIRVSVRIHELKQLAEDTTEAYQRALYQSSH